MKRISYFLRTALLSQEMGCMSVFYLAWRIWPQAFQDLAASLNGSEGIKLLAAVPFAALAFMIKEVPELLFPPEDDKSKDLSSWPNYWKLKYTVVASGCWTFACAGGALAMVVFTTPSDSPQWLAALLAVSVCSVVNTASLFLARMKIREILCHRGL